MVEYWERTRVKGSGEKMQAEEIVIHRRGADAVGMAMRRNPDMPKCDRISVVTEEAFLAFRQDPGQPGSDYTGYIREIPKHAKLYIPRDVLRGEWEYIQRDVLRGGWDW